LGRYRELLLQLTDELQLKDLLVLQGVEGALEDGELLEGGLAVGAPREGRGRELSHGDLRIL
jgi:hypothetical protein